MDLFCLVPSTMEPVSIFIWSWWMVFKGQIVQEHALLMDGTKGECLVLGRVERTPLNMTKKTDRRSRFLSTQCNLSKLWGLSGP